MAHILKVTLQTCIVSYSYIKYVALKIVFRNLESLETLNCSLKWKLEFQLCVISFITRRSQWGKGDFLEALKVKNFNF